MNKREQFSKWCRQVWGLPGDLISSLISIWENKDWLGFDQAPMDDGFGAFIEFLEDHAVIDSRTAETIMIWSESGRQSSRDEERESRSRRTVPPPQAPRPRDRDGRRDSRPAVYVSPVRAAPKNKGNPFSWIIDSVDDRLPPNAPDFINGTTVVFGGLALVAILVIVVLAFAFMRGGTNSTVAPVSQPVSSAAVPASTVVAPVPTPVDPQVLLEPAKVEVNLLARPFTLQGWVDQFPWFLITFLTMVPLALIILLVSDRLSSQELTDLRVIGIGLLMLLVAMIAAEGWTALLQKMKVEPPPGFSPNTLVILGLLANIIASGIASYQGKTDWTGLAVSGFFIPGMFLAGWYSHDLTWSTTGWVMMILGLAVEILEISRLHRTLAAVIIGVVAMAMFYVGIGVGLLAVYGVDALAVANAASLVNNAPLKVAVRAIHSSRTLIAAFVGAATATFGSQPLAMIFVKETTRAHTSDRNINDRAAETARWDSMIIGVMLVALTVVPLAGLVLSFAQ